MKSQSTNRLILCSLGLLILLTTSAFQAIHTLPPLFPPDPVDPAQLNIRIERGKLFNRFHTGLPLDQQPPGMPPIVSSIDFAARAELPADLCDTIVVGTIQSALPYLSQDRRMIYTEYIVRVDETVSEVKPHIFGNMFVIVEIGGVGRLPDGRVLRHEVRGLGSPLAINSPYVFFLTYHERGQCYRVAKAWQLWDGQAVPVAEDDIARSQKGQSRFAGMCVAQFLDVVRQLKATLQR